MSISRRSVLGVMAGVGPTIIVRRVTAAQAEGAQICARAVSRHPGIAQGLPGAELVPGRQVRDLGALGTGIGPEFGDWYAQRMYLEGNQSYKYHLENYGHPSKFGYKDICREVWKGNKFDPDAAPETV